jgi:ribonuclease HII
MNCLAGVDEAGLGPVLGPLVVAGIAMTGPPGQDPWKLLSRRISRDRTEKDKIRVADSKKVYQGNHGLERLERTVLTFLAAHGQSLPGTIEQLLELAHCDLSVLRRCPWYRKLDKPIPMHGDRKTFELEGHLLSRELERTGIKLLGIALRPVDAGEFNDLLATSHNKGVAHFRAYGEVIARLLRTMPHGAHLVADRAGSRMRYGEDLGKLVVGGTLTVLEEDERRSAYLIEHGGKTHKVTFVTEAEQRAFPTALASCFAKYLRELMLSVLNDWFCARMPGLSPTAGYWVDGHRFLDDVRSLIEKPGFPRDLLVRAR